MQGSEAHTQVSRDRLLTMATKRQIGREGAIGRRLMNKMSLIHTLSYQWWFGEGGGG
jgi:hypothetical protein